MNRFPIGLNLEIFTGGGSIMTLKNPFLAMTHGWRKGGANPSHTLEGLEQVYNMDAEIESILWRAKPTLLVVAMNERMIETYQMTADLMDVFVKPQPEIWWDWLLGAGGSVDKKKKVFITDHGMEFPANRCVPLGQEVAWYHLHTIDALVPGPKFLYAVKQYFSNLGIDSKSGSIYDIVWKMDKGREQRHVECLVKEGKILEKPVRENFIPR